MFCDQCGHSLGLPVEKSLESDQVVSAPALTDEGFALTRDDNWEAAVEKYRRAIQVEPEYGRAYGNLGFALNKLGRHDEAIEYVPKDFSTLGLLPTCTVYTIIAGSRSRD